MYEYKVFKWRFDLNSAEDLEKTLNDYGKKGWKVFNIISNIKGNGGVLFASVDGNEATIILEKSN
ncbi:DUF4177 domain-containing protein [Clostridium senegalense]|uniref:DUF4177 domain-containing protein n=1 Tax=Clostridium senegalense TaxID=1465809 RepID=A0A6M0H446_9CLOT|nr:DUF4177 domain-containing protein [Clostridium senegalense]NEU05307.1 DUF4177 domain-containing protein [Clostridium senegalense]